MTSTTNAPGQLSDRHLVLVLALCAVGCGSAAPEPREPTDVASEPAAAEPSSPPDDEAPVAAADAGPVAEPVDAGAPAGGDSAADAGAGGVASATPTAVEAFAAARPALERHCDRCHGAAGGRQARRHLDTSSATPGGHHAHELGRELRRVLGATGRRATMPPDARGSVTGDDLAALLAWADAIEREHGPTEQ
ncbi:MAG: hypothetical protein IT379_06380 [Deltaproteobacteria bacterium]|nr:hypothetical protein [Deltaproteobacteria bacterium]